MARTIGTWAVTSLGFDSAHGAERRKKMSNLTEEPSINLKAAGGAEFDAQLDGDGDLYVCTTNDTSCAMYLNPTEARALRDWLNKVLP